MNIGLGEANIAPPRDLKIRPGLFLKQQFNELITEMGQHPKRELLLDADLVFGLSAGFFHLFGYDGVALASAVGGLVTTGITAAVETKPLLNIAIKSLIEKKIPINTNKLSREQFSEIISNNIQAVVPIRDGFEVRERIVTSIPYKEKLIETFAKDFKSTQDVKYIWDLMLKMPNHHLKLETIKELSKHGKKYFQEFVYTHIDANDLTELERATLSQLALDWKLINRTEKIEELSNRAKQLEILSSNKIAEASLKVAEYATKKLKEDINFNETMIPFIKLFSIRRLGQEIFENNRLVFDSQFSEKITQELISQFTTNKRGFKETTYDQESPTVGLEIQPIPSSQEPMALKIDYQEILNLVEYAGLQNQTDIPFEIRLTPSKSPITQLMMLREILMITGLPIDRAGIQINFGGFGEESSKPEVLALQRMILSARRLQPPTQAFKQYGKFWDLNDGNIDYPHIKPEIKLRGNDSEEFQNITPIDNDHGEFKLLSEIRAPVGSKDFMSFARGLLASHKMASLVKAWERVQKNTPNISQREIEMSKDWEIMKNEFDKECDTFGLPKIDAEWSREDWKKFANVVTEENNHFSKRSGQIFLEAKSLKK